MKMFILIYVDFDEVALPTDPTVSHTTVSQSHIESGDTREGGEDSDSDERG